MISEIQAKFLKNFSNYKAFARKEEWSRISKVPYQTLVDQLVELKFLKKNKAGAVSLASKGHEAVGTYHGCQADATRKMWSDASVESAKAFNCNFGKPY